MSKYSYLLTEVDSENVFAVIQDIEDNVSDSNIDLINKTGQAVEDEFAIEDRVKLVHGSIKEDNSGDILISFRYLDEIGEEEIRDFKLTTTTIY